MKKIVSIILLSAILITGASCSSNTIEEHNTTNSQDSAFETTPSIDTPNNNENAPKHYEFDLNINNFNTFLTFSSEQGYYLNAYVNNHINIVSGVLSYAYYENVVVTFDVVYKKTDSLSHETTYTGEYSVILNAAGDATFYANDRALLDTLKCGGYDTQIKKTFTIKRVSGKVIFTA